jgi:hypothetical protein
MDLRVKKTGRRDVMCRVADILRTDHLLTRAISTHHLDWTLFPILPLTLFLSPLDKIPIYFQHVETRAVDGGEEDQE